MPNSQMLRDMALFVEVAKQKSFSKAATTLGMPISSLSRRVSDFEQMVGLRLLDRTTRRIALTSYGEAYLAQASRLVDEAEQAFDNLVAEAKGPSGFLKIAAPPDFWVLHHLSRIVTEFSAQHEHIHVHLDLKPNAVDLVGDNYDLAVTIVEPRETSLIMRRVAEVANGLFAAPDYLNDRGWPKEPHDLKDHSAIVPTQGTGTTWSLSRNAETIPLQVRIAHLQLTEPRTQVRASGTRHFQRALPQRQTRCCKRSAGAGAVGVGSTADAGLHRHDFTPPASEGT